MAADAPEFCLSEGRATVGTPFTRNDIGARYYLRIL